MLNVQLVKKTNFEGFTMLQEAVNEKGVHNVLIITDSEDTKKYWESKNVRVELTRSIDDTVVSSLRPSYKDVDTIFITTPKMIARYFNETVNVKRVKAEEMFHAFNSTIYILSDYSNVSNVVSNSDRTDAKAQESNRVAKITASKNRGFARLK